MKIQTMSFAMVVAVATSARYVDGNPVQGVTGDTLDGWDWAEIRCVATNGPQHEAILVEKSERTVP